MPGPTSNEMIVSSTTSFMLVPVSPQSNTAILAANVSNPLTSTEGRLLMIKASSDSGPSIDASYLTCSNGVSFYPSSSNATLQPYECATLLENPANVYNIVNLYQNISNYVSAPDPGTTVVNVSGSNSMLFVDLRTESKVFVLPPIPDLTGDEKQAPSFIFKDVYGSLAYNTWYISTSGGSDSFDGLGTTLRFETSNTAIQVVGRRGNRDTFNCNYWYIVSAYNP